jgi:hypothetical protein
MVLDLLAVAFPAGLDFGLQVFLLLTFLLRLGDFEREWRLPWMRSF